MAARVASVAYLQRRNDQYSFRRVVPRHMVHRLGRREVKVSLNTPDLSVARRRGRLLANRFEELIEMIEANPQNTQHDNDEQVRRYMAREWACAELDTLNPNLEPGEEVSRAMEGVEELECRIRSGVVDSVGLAHAFGDGGPARVRRNTNESQGRSCGLRGRFC